MSKLQETRFQLQNSKNCNYLFIYFLTLRHKLASIHILISGEPKYNAVWAIFYLILCILEQQTLWHIMICFVFVYLCVIVSTVAAATAGRLPLCLSVSYNCCSLIRLNSGQRNRRSILLSRSVIILVPFFMFFLPSNWWTAAQLNGGRLC